jgi:hypothetical protein
VFLPLSSELITWKLRNIWNNYFYNVFNSCLLQQIIFLCNNIWKFKEFPVINFNRFCTEDWKLRIVKSIPECSYDTSKELFKTVHVLIEVQKSAGSLCQNCSVLTDSPTIRPVITEYLQVRKMASTLLFKSCEWGNDGRAATVRFCFKWHFPCNMLVG